MPSMGKVPVMKTESVLEGSKTAVVAELGATPPVQLLPLVHAPETGFASHVCAMARLSAPPASSRQMASTSDAALHRGNSRFFIHSCLPADTSFRRSFNCVQARKRVESSQPLGQPPRSPQPALSHS